MKFFVKGGIYKNFSFKEIIEDTEELYGPFESFQEAYDLWKSKSWLNVDNAQYRLRIVKEDLI